MTETPPATAPAPSAVPAEPEAPQHGFAGHVEAWVAEHLAPVISDVRSELADARVKAENAATAAAKLGTLLQEHAALIGELARAVSPADGTAAAGLVAKAEALAARGATIAAELAAL